jgi:hypothetical protein
MWRGYEEALKVYYNMAVGEWLDRGYKNTMEMMVVDISKLIWPPWLSDERFVASHRSNLLRKDPVFYGKYGWTESPDLPYFWPTKEGY